MLLARAQVMLQGEQAAGSISHKDFLAALEHCMQKEQAVMDLVEQPVLALEQACQYLLNNQVRA
jgi:hypothetical protein